ncbi:DUF4348 domain-containing protein [Solitalea canadensis]|uniref:DUF4348 domain-containing protein n=1 Tax=Solitalea canadensis (strain ATCC 29591 / DSM 3403 / JCM 21819 / LMG 8368 / NBRC 15130 / NCIMB 12057 / USAM 9D) TaxID=929556 RepID=H8KLB5_SOLCM|nr:DUF4348 domain-containing protein [Solitalea canadensis]AFD08617.1 hypothetical protein Solca_3613 [Solitalea canadensis DSM 3403]
MLKRHFILSFSLATMLTSCESNSTNTKSQHSNETAIISTKETVDNNFNDFIEKFSTDSAFQLNRTKFPLKTKWYDIFNDRDSLIYRNRLDFEVMDFRKKTLASHLDQWEQKIVVDKNNTSATIEIRGIENGIRVDYLFKKINGAWMLIEINDSST